jgi:hypothetical protein
VSRSQTSILGSTWGCTRSRKRPASLGFPSAPYGIGSMDTATRPAAERYEPNGSSSLCLRMAPSFSRS